MKQSGKYSSITFVLLVLTMIIYGCGSSSEVSDNSNSSSNTVCESIAGTWWVTDTIDESACGGGTQYDSYEATIKQSDCNITVTVGRDSFSGSINGSTVSWTGSYPAESGTVTISSMALNKAGSRMTGTANWTLNDGQETCSGSTEMSGTRI